MNTGKSKDEGKAKKGKLKENKNSGLSEKQIEEMVDEAVAAIDKMNGNMKGSDESGKREITLSASKPIAQIKKGDKIKIDGNSYEVDAHYVLMDHGSTKEMAIEIFDSKSDKDLQIRYFDDQLENTLDLYELQEIMYFKKPFKKIEW